MKGLPLAALGLLLSAGNALAEEEFVVIRAGAVMTVSTGSSTALPAATTRARMS